MCVTTQAHYQNFKINATLHLWIPEHEPREKDPHYGIFRAAKKKMLALDTGCWRCGVKPSDMKRDGKRVVTDVNPLGAMQIEAHHDKIEFSQQAGVDIEKFKTDYPEFNISDEESFLEFLESEHNLLALCDVCHRSPLEGVHYIPEPLWRIRRYWRKGLPDFIQKAT